MDQIEIVYWASVLVYALSVIIVMMIHVYEDWMEIYTLRDVLLPEDSGIESWLIYMPVINTLFVLFMSIKPIFYHIFKLLFRFFDWMMNYRIK